MSTRPYAVHLITTKRSQRLYSVACGLAVLHADEDHRGSRCRSEVTCRCCRGTRAFDAPHPSPRGNT